MKDDNLLAMRGGWAGVVLVIRQDGATADPRLNATATWTFGSPPCYKKMTRLCGSNPLPCWLWWTTGIGYGQPLVAGEASPYAMSTAEYDPIVLGYNFLLQLGEH